MKRILSLILIMMVPITLHARTYTITPEVNQNGPIDFTRMIRPNEYRRYSELKQTRSLTTWTPSSAFNLHKSRPKQREFAYNLPKWQMDLAYLHDRDTWERFNRSKKDKHWIYNWTHYIEAKMEEMNIRWIRKVHGAQTLQDALVWEPNLKIGRNKNGKFKSETLKISHVLYNHQRILQWIGYVFGTTIHFILMLLVFFTACWKLLNFLNTF